VWVAGEAGPLRSAAGEGRGAEAGEEAAEEAEGPRGVCREGSSFKDVSTTLLSSEQSVAAKAPKLLMTCFGGLV
jgi:hypothetical protein